MNMKNGLRGLSIASVMALASTVFAAESRVTVTWAPTDQLSEVKQNQAKRGWQKPAEWEKTLGDYLRRVASERLAPGETLDVTIDDIKLAGDYEPWHSPQATDIRFMKDIYPPRVDLHYRLTDASGKTIRESSAKLRDLSYLQNVSMPNDTDPLRYDKHLLNDWVRKEFRTDKT